jgi:pimeloyl-ACP methyl ester carboxylesterase
MIVEVNGVELNYEIVGDGEPLLWLHGFMGAGPDWRYIFNEPPSGFQLIAPDLRGHGASTNPSCEFSFRQAADDVEGLLGHLGLDTVKAVGLSGGGITLLHMATARPTRIASMVLVSAPPYFPAQARALQRQTAESMFGKVEMDLMRARHRLGDAQLQQLFAHSRALADRYDDVNFTPSNLAAISAGTLIVFGDRDPLYPVSLAFELKDAMPQSYLWVVPNAGHAPVFGDNARRFAETATSFLRGDWTRASTA